jgi:hypothetical protein
MSFDGGEGAHVWATAMEAWPDSVASLGYAFERVDLTSEDRAACLALAEGRAGALSSTLIEDLDVVSTPHSEGTHIRFGLGSLKLGPVPPRFYTGREFASALNRPNARVASMLRGYVEEDLDAGLFIFPWRDIPRWREFRLFLREGELIGASQYHTGQVFPEVVENAVQISESVADFAQRFSEVSHIVTVVADVSVEGTGPFDARLIELNPFIKRTDPCMYDWSHGGNFDRRLRYKSY